MSDSREEEIHQAIPETPRDPTEVAQGLFKVFDINYRTGEGLTPDEIKSFRKDDLAGLLSEAKEVGPENVLEALDKLRNVLAGFPMRLVQSNTQKIESLMAGMAGAEQAKPYFSTLRISQENLKEAGVFGDLAQVNQAIGAVMAIS